jgi:signal transduction histidine kinase
MSKVSLNLTLLAAHLALVAAATSLALLITQLTVHPPLSDLVLLAALMTLLGLAATLFGHLAISLAPHLRFASLQARIGGAAVLGSILALASILIVAELMFISSHDLSLLIALLIFSLAVALPLALVTAASLGDSISDLSRGTSAMAAGDLSIRVPVHGSDEFARLAVAFNQMAEHLQAANHRQAELEQARRSLVAAVSHDLRTPLASLRAATEALRDGVVSDPPTVKRYLSSIQAEAQRLGGLIDDLFELSLIDSGNVRLDLEPTLLADLISETVESMNHQARLKKIHLSGRCQSHLTPILADPLKIRRVILNLVQNAIRHTPSDGAVSLEAREVEAAIAVSVTDNCGGIQQRDINRLFEPFYRGDPARLRDGSGAGLGLSIAKGIVEAHGGRIWVENSSRNGCRFSFTLPKLTAAA